MSLKNQAMTAALLLTLGLSGLAVADSHMEKMPASSSVKDELLMWIGDAEDKLTDLADVTPEAKYSWQPSKDVRTTGGVFMHVAAANFGVPSFAGVKPPEGFNFETYEKSLTKKPDIEKALESSFDHMKKALKGMSDEDLNKPVDMFGMKTTARGAYLLLLSHAHEHLGQSIAYARMNGIVPPWTAKQQAAMKEMQEKEKAKKQAAGK